jgi:hypothetical protein
MAAAAGCGPVLSKESASVVRDSAGIVIVENNAPQWRRGEGWRVTAEPTLVIGSDDATPEYHFDRIRGIRRLTDGTIVVADGRDNELRYFDRRGAFVGRVGRPGAGPGEFRYLTSILRLEGDSILTFDQVLWRISVFAPSRLLAREVSLTPIAASLEFVALLPDGRHLLANRASLIPEARPDGVHRFPRRYFRYSRDGLQVDTIAEFPGFEFEIRFDRVASNWGATQVPFARNTFDASNGLRWFVGDNARFAIQQLDGSGKVTRIIRYAKAERRLDDSLTNSLEAATVAGQSYRNAKRMAAIRRTFREVARPPNLPAFGSLHLDPHGNLLATEWTSSFAAPDQAARRWWAFDREGVLLGEITAPAAFRMHEIGDDYVLGVTSDELGVERIAMFPLVRAE